MKKLKYLIAFIGIITIFTAGCSNPPENEEQYINVQKRIDDGYEYEDFREITKQVQVQKVKDILGDINWDNAKVEMNRHADYNFVFQFKNPKIETKAVLYEIWISPNNDKLELAASDNKYARLDKNISAQLFEILTGEKLSESN